MALIHWWPLNGDTKGYGLNPINLTNNGATVNNSGKIGKCYSFNGDTNYLSISSQDIFDCFKGGSTQFSITMWLYNNESSGARGILFGDYSTTGAINFNIELNGNATNNSVRFYWNGSPNWAASNSIVAINTWSHVAVVYDGSAIRVYINGILKDTRSGSLGSLNKTTGAFYLGRDGRTGSTAFNGRINDFRIYDEALSDKEVKKISQGLILHYNPDYAIRSSCWTGGYDGDYGFSYAGGVSGMAQSDVSDSSLPSGKYRKITWTATGSNGGPHTGNHGPSINGATYTTSFYWKSKGYKPSPNAENYTSEEVYTTLAPNGWWYTQIIGKYNASAEYSALTFYSTPPNGTACELDVSSIKIEPGDFATPYRRDNKSYIPDSSGFYHDGTIVSEAIEKSIDHRYKKNIVADGNPEHYIQSNINPSFLTSGVTFNVWYKNINKSQFLIATGQITDHYYVMAMNDTGKWCGIGMSGEQIYYIDGQPRTVGDGYPKDGQWHMYTFVGTNIGTWTALYWGHHPAASWNYNGPLGDIRLYATALSAADVKALYNETRVTRPMQFLISNSSALASLTSSNPVLADGELVVVRSTDAAGKTYFNIRKGNGVNNFNSLPWKQVSEAILKGWRSSFVSDAGSLVADKGSYSNLGGGD